MNTTATPDAAKTEPTASAVAAFSFQVDRELLYTLLRRVTGVIESSQVLQILSYVKIAVNGQDITLTGTDSEVELTASGRLDQSYGEQAFAVSGRKLLDICRSLPSDASLTMSVDNDWLTLKTESGYFTLGILSCEGFPDVRLGDVKQTLNLSQDELVTLLKKTSFAMASQDIRYFLNGLCLSLEADRAECVATDGHRLALHAITVCNKDIRQAILPRKAVHELMKLIEPSNQPCQIVFSDQHACVVTDTFKLTTSLINVRYPDCGHLLAAEVQDEAIIEVSVLKQLLSCCSAILASEKFKAAKFHFSPGSLMITSSNVNQEKTEESMTIDYQGAARQFAFNIDYVRDVLSVIEDTHIKVQLAEDENGVVFKAQTDDTSSVYMIMPLTL